MKNTCWFAAMLFLALNITTAMSSSPYASFNDAGNSPVSLNLAVDHPDIIRNRVIPVFMVLTGLGIAGIWTMDMASGKFSGQGNFFKWREGEMLFWPHITAEYLTAAALATAGLGLWQGKEWALSVSMLSLGALTYTAINSSGWVLAERNRLPYGIPMWVSLGGAIVSIAVLL